MTLLSVVVCSVLLSAIARLTVACGIKAPAESVIAPRMIVAWELETDWGCACDAVIAKLIVRRQWQRRLPVLELLWGAAKCI